MKRKLFAVSMAAAMATSCFAGTAFASDSEPVTIKVTRACFNLANPDSEQVKKVQDAINEYIKDKINVQIELTDIGSVSYTHLKGKAAHAAGSPHLGVDALNAAALGLTALQYQRETFQDKDTVRVHPIMTKGGDLVNVIPNEAIIETLVRANNTKAILDASEKTDRAFLAGAVAVGAKVEIETMPGYLPTIPVDAPEELVEAAKLAAGDKYNVNVVDATSTPSGGSTDVGEDVYKRQEYSAEEKAKFDDANIPVIYVDAEDDETVITLGQIFNCNAKADEVACVKAALEK